MSTIQTNRIQHSTGVGNNIVLSDTGDTQVNSLNGSALDRNRLINGNMEIQQRPGFTAQGSGFACDRWFVNASGSGTCTAGCVDATGVWAEAGIDQVLRINALAGGGRVALRQGIELPQTGRPGEFVEGSTWSFSCFSLDDLRLRVRFQNSVQNPTDDLVVQDFVQLANNNNVRSATFTIPNIDALSAATTALAVEIFRQDDSTTEGFDISNCQLEPGPVPTGYAKKAPALELLLCQRYFSPLGTGLTHRYNSPTSCRVFPANTLTTIGSWPVAGIVDINPAGTVSFAGMFTATGSATVTDVNATYTSISIGTARRFMLNGLSANLATNDFYSISNTKFFLDREL